MSLTAPSSTPVPLWTARRTAGRNPAPCQPAWRQPEIVWLQNRPVAALDSSEQDATPQIAWLHSDHLLTARAATDASQNLIWRWHSDAFGMGEAESLVSASNPEAQSVTLNLRFPGQYHDNESGLYYNYFRTYDPSMGRYTQSDPIGLLGGINTFAYVGGNPIARFDPHGLLIVYPDNDPDFKRDVELARQYLPLLDQYFKVIDAISSENMEIKRTNDIFPEAVFRPQDLPDDCEPWDADFNTYTTIYWNPEAGSLILDGTGSFQSPALVLLHEMAHAHEYFTNREGFFEGVHNARDDGYTTDEEWRVISGPETTAALQAGEPVRQCHRATSTLPECTKAIEVDSVTTSQNNQKK